MARTKKEVATMAAPQEVTYTLTEAQFNNLKSIANLVSDARSELHGFSVDNLAEAGFIVGQAFAQINKAEDLVDELVEAFASEEDYDFDY